MATCTIKRRNYEPVTRSFSWEDAKQARLSAKQGPWQEYPKRMLQMRARGFALRDTFADVLKGLYVGEEARDMPPEMRDVTPAEPEPSAATKSDAVRGKLRKAMP